MAKLVARTQEARASTAAALTVRNCMISLFVKERVCDALSVFGRGIYFWKLRSWKFYISGKRVVLVNNECKAE